ncbi:hypothetical protein Mpsy_1657 [Methanolobus psychrophilus R15]|nr:hypothetical protein Mpsy_1657 [Methanolobus psychrophilus R15]
MEPMKFTNISILGGKDAAPRSERKVSGKALRKQVPLESHGVWKPAQNRPNPLSLLQAQDEGRLQHLLPIKYGRMLASPFAFLRGSAVVMAADLAATPVMGIQTLLCGDAHIANFGLFATPERKLVFDINDFDEAFPGPWEWDLKRLATSAAVAGREIGLSRKACRDIAVTISRNYSDAMKRFSEMHTLNVWYYTVDADAILEVFQLSSSEKGKRTAEKTIAKARSKTQERTLEQLTAIENGQRHIISNPPLLVPMNEMDFSQFLNPDELKRMSDDFVEDAWSQYLESLPDERRFLLLRFHILDSALRVGGVGSVGTRCFIALLQGGAEDEFLMLQLKEAGRSVLEDYVPKRLHVQPARRVVTAQRLMQAASDMFLGWHTGPVKQVDYYWRQFKDMKGSFDVTNMDKSSFRVYVTVCSWCLARAHARTSDASSISGYLGNGKSFAEAIGDFAVAYADQTVRDHQALVEAVRSGHIQAKTGI